MLPALQLVPTENAPLVPEPASDALPASRSDPTQPREWSILSRYLPDPSLRYTTVRVGGSSVRRFLLLVTLSSLAVACVVVPLWRLLSHNNFRLSSLLALPGALACVLLFRPLLSSARETRTRAFFWRTVRLIELGLDRAVFQPGNTFRYEVHLPAVLPVDLHEVQVRLVFWESWFERVMIPWIRVRRWAVRKQGHDLVSQTALALQLARGQHGVVRGEIRVPLQRPTEHHRGKPRHLSYVNLTVTLVATEKRWPSLFTGDCPHLITFPWM